MQFLIFLFALAAFVWMIPIVHGGRLLRLSVLVLLVGTAFGPDFFAIDGFIQISLDRVLWASMLALAVVQFRLGNLRIARLTRIDFLIAAIIAYFFLSGMGAGSGPYMTKSFSRWLFYAVMPAGLYLMARVVEIRAEDIRWFCKVVLGLGVYLAATSVFEVAGYHFAVFPRYIVDPDVWLFYGRGRGPLLNPVGNGFIITIGTVACVLGFFSSDRRMKLIYAGLFIVLVLGAYATLTRSVWIGLILAVGVIAFVYSPRWLRILSLAATVLLAGAMTIGLKDQLLAFKRDKDLSAQEAAKSIELRPLLAIVAWEMFKDKPITGHGFGRYFEHSKPFHDIRSYKAPLEKVKGYYQHNTFLAILVDTGLIGISLFVGLLASLCGIGWRLTRDRKSTPEIRQVGLLMLGAMASYCFNGLFHDMMIIPMSHMFLFFLAGIAVTVYQYGFAERPQRDVRRQAAMPVPMLGG
ncbi:MAG: O-antigen ligase family protein [Pirellulaceae bacterium]|nr:O-antigen ligase family protein [Pirellulaceae bacterium]